MVKVKIDGVTIEVEPGTSVLAAAEKAGLRIPHLCVVKGIYEGASCRLCLVKTPTGRLFPACAYYVYRDEEFISDSLDLRIERKVNFEFILKFHRMECWLCPRKGNCLLAKLSKELAVEGTPVCAECPLSPEECLLTKGVPCLGPITLSGCDAECVESGGPCWGCRGPISRVDVLENAFSRYRELGIDTETILRKADIFWNSLPEFEVVKKVFNRVRTS